MLHLIPIGGHIAGAINLQTDNEVESHLFQDEAVRCCDGQDLKHVIIFHCEFSQERGPKLAQYLRRTDRLFNASEYPRLFFPEIYVLEGGYLDFFQRFKSYCEPQLYVPMRDERHSQDLKREKLKRGGSYSSSCGNNARRSFKEDFTTTSSNRRPISDTFHVDKLKRNAISFKETSVCSSRLNNLLFPPPPPPSTSNNAGNKTESDNMELSKEFPTIKRRLPLTDKLKASTRQWSHR
eukprot:Partr_v1_DN26924_c3_g2_i2_m6992 putative cell division cycle 25 homolog